MLNNKKQHFYIWGLGGGGGGVRNIKSNPIH